LLEGWGRATRGRGSIAFIDGAPGIGKSRLVEELSRTVEERGGRVLAGTTGFPEALPYQALVEALRDALPILASTQLDPTTLAVLATLLPELSHLVEGLGLPRPLAPERERARTLTALAHAFVAIAQPRALLLVLEDLHWSQDATTAALGVLARRTPLTQIFVVATYRDGDLPRKHSLRALRGEALRARWASGVTLGPLGSEDVAEIVRRVSPLVEPSAELHAACAGNPLLLDQLLAAPTTPLQAKGVRIGAIVGAQLERLSSHARSFAEIAALVGARFSHEVVRESGGWDNASANDALDELLDRKIVNEAGGYGDFDYAFAHQLVCDIVLENAPPRRAADRHRRIARALEALYPERKPEFATQLARHYELAHEPERAGANYVIAGHRALVMSALEEAHAHLRRGMDLSTDAKARADAFIDLYELSRRQGGPSDAAAALAGLDDAVERLNDAEYRRTAALLRARLSSSNNDAAATGAARERLRKLAADAGPRWEALYRIEEASAAMHRAEFERADTESQQALSAARASGDFPAIARALILVARLRRDTGDVDSALALLQESVETAFRAGDGAIELDALMLAHLLSYEDERFSLFVPTAERWLERAINLGDRYAEDLARVRLAMALVAMRRDVARAVEELRKPIDVSESGSHLGLGRLQQNRGIVFSELGDFSEAIACFEDANAHFKAVDDTIGCAITFSGLALIHAWAGDPQLGRQQALAALELVPRYEAIHTGARDNLAVTVALCGDLDEAIALGTQVLADLQRLSGKRWYPRLLADLALWNAQSGDLRSARDYVEKLLAGTLPITTEKPQSCPWTAAQVLRACGDGTRARAELERAYNLVAPLAEQLTGDARARFVTVPWNREIIAAYERDEWPTLAPLTASV
ncbi:MAG: AAA family ATPase, partial [Candidatus Eremiobacteraeota bacterium]|nr:AAA family ATPase [Candidatus Eremiobacteraeota bacterium]